MLEIVLSGLGAFLLYVLVLPLFGVLAGFVIYLGLPYFTGVAIASVAHKLFHGSFVDLGIFWVVAVLWAFLLVHIRKLFINSFEDNHAWYEGHFLAASTILFAGRPYRKRKRELVT